MHAQISRIHRPHHALSLVSHRAFALFCKLFCCCQRRQGAYLHHEWHRLYAVRRIWIAHRRHRARLRTKMSVMQLLWQIRHPYCPKCTHFTHFHPHSAHFIRYITRSPGKSSVLRPIFCQSTPKTLLNPITIYAVIASERSERGDLVPNGSQIASSSSDFSQ